MSRIINIPKNHELRVQLQFGQEARVKTLEGAVASFGFPIGKEKAVVFRDEPFAISAFNDSRVCISVGNVPYYIAKFTVPEIVEECSDSLHVIMIVGRPSSGKTSLAKLILNTRFLCEKRCFYVNADPSQAPIGLPGCIGCMEVKEQITNEGFPFVDPLLFTFGNTEIKEDHKELFMDQLMELKRLMFEKMNTLHQNEKPVNCIVIDFPLIYPLDESYCELTKRVCEEFGVTHILCLGDDFLPRILPKNPEIMLINFPVLPGAVYIDFETKAKLRAQQIKKYFFGTPENPLAYTILTFPRSTFKISSFGPLRYISSIMLPSGMERPNPKLLSNVGLTSLLTNRVLAIIEDKKEPAKAYLQNVLSFYIIKSISDAKPDEPDGIVEVIAPNEDPLPAHIRIAGSIEFVDPKL